jgi:hypothetical protein
MEAAGVIRYIDLTRFPHYERVPNAVTNVYVGVYVYIPPASWYIHQPSAHHNGACDF